MIVVRNVFQLKFGKARDAIAVWQEGIGMMREKGIARESRLLTDATGPFYTLVMEETFDGLADIEREMQSITGDKEWRAWYDRFVPLVESGYREVFNVVGSSVPGLGSAASARAATAGR